MPDIPIKVVGSSTFGRYPKISAAKTVNMFISDDWLVNYPGYKKVSQLEEGSGRGLFHSIRGNFLIYVVNASVYKIEASGSSISFNIIGTINTKDGEVYIDENLASMIMIVDGVNAYIYNYSTTGSETFTTLSTDPDYFNFSPSYVSYINSFFLVSPSPNDDNPQLWYVYEVAESPPSLDKQVIQVGAATGGVGGQFALQTKPDAVQAVLALPGRGNNVLVLGSSVAEIWNQVGGEENFRRNSSFNIDYGVVSRATVAASDTFICWLSQNENSSPVIMVSDGSSAKQLSTDGITYQLQEINFPSVSTAFFYKQDGHIFYQLTFFHPEDNLSIIYDFTTNMFFHVTDNNLNYHPARQVVFFNETTYFASLQEGAIFEMSSNIVDAIYEVDALIGEDIPRIRVTDTIRNPKNAIFRVNEFEFLMEQGVNNYSGASEGIENCEGLLITEGGDDIADENGELLLSEGGYCTPNLRRPRVDMSMSKNGGQTFSNIIGRYINFEGAYRNRITWHRLGFCNEFTVQLRFWGIQRFVCNNGYIEVDA